MAHDVGERRHRPDLETALRVPDPPELRDHAEVHHDGGPLDAVLEPVEGIQAAGQDPGLVPVLVEQIQRGVDRGRLVEVERRNHVPDRSHLSFSP